MELQHFEEEEDIHICGLCKARFNDVQLFLHHKDFSCPVKLARKHDETQKVSVANHALTTSLPESNVVHLIDHSTPDITSSTLEFECEDPGLIRPAAVYNVKPGSEQAIDSEVEQTRVNINIVDTFENHAHYAEPAEEQTDTNVAETGTPDYVLFANEQETNQYRGHVNQVVQIKPSIQSAYDVESHDHNLNSGKQFTTLTNHPLLQCITNNKRELAPARELVPVQSNAATSTTSQLPAFITTGEITDNVTQPTSAGENLAAQIQERIEEGIENAQPVQYSFNFNPNDENTSQNDTAASTSHTTFTPKITYSLSTNRDVFRPIHPAKRTKIARPKKLDKTKTEEKKERKPLEKKYKCMRCHYKTAYLKDLERHQRIHTGERPYKCTICDKAFNRNDKLTLHMKYHQNQRSFHCDLCEYKAVERSSLKKHMKTHLDYRPYACQVCPYKARTSSGLQIHLRIHTGDAPFRCKDCGAEFKVNSDLTRHKRVHSGEKPFQCTEPGCDYRCSIKSNLRSHMNTNHRYDHMLSCETCDFKTSSTRAFHEHGKTHKVQNELKCMECNYQCASKSALRNHKKIHLGNIQKCNYCSYTSYQNGNVLAHMRRKHNLSTKSRSKSSKSKTKSLPSTPQKSSDRLRIKAKCQKHYKCDKCEAAFVREDSLRCHLKQHYDSPLSTAYAVLKLQKPVLKPLLSAPQQQQQQQTVSVGNPAAIVDQSGDKVTENQSDSSSYSPVKGNGDGSQVISRQDQTSQIQTANLGINDILAAARLSGLTSCENSPTTKKPLDQFIFQDSQDSGSNVAAISSVTTVNNNESITFQQQQQQHSDSTVQLTQNVTLPYMRLPDGQILILTGQNSSPSMIQQSNPVPSSQIIPNIGNTMQTQIIAQQPTTEQQQIIQIPENFTTNSAQNVSSTQDSGAIPIQIILPNDSQQSFPLVSQLLNSVMNKGNTEILDQTTSNTDSQKDVVNVGMQNFVVQIPAQSGNLKDQTGSIGEGQSFVLQIPGSGISPEGNCIYLGNS